MSRWSRWLAKGVHGVVRNAPRVARVAGRAVDAASDVAVDTRDAFRRGLRGEPEPAPKRPKARPTGKQLDEWYANLEIEPGADLDQVHRAWKRLQRRYHPDLHADDAERAARATELIQQLNAAYAGLKAHLET